VLLLLHLQPQLLLSSLLFRSFLLQPLLLPLLQLAGRTIPLLAPVVPGYYVDVPLAAAFYDFDFVTALVDDVVLVAHCGGSR
jgi:hypothetical protein